MEKKCTHCGESKNTADFYKNKSRPDGLNVWCKPCATSSSKTSIQKKSEYYRAKNRARYLENKSHRRNQNRANQFNVPLNWYTDQLDKQQGVCAICSNPEPIENRSLAVDHDHRCCAGKKSCGECVRALLCSNCNKGLGAFKDSENFLENALHYLRSFKYV